VSEPKRERESPRTGTNDRPWGFSQGRAHLVLIVAVPLVIGCFMLLPLHLALPAMIPLGAAVWWLRA